MSLIWLELVLGFAVPLAWGLRELLLLRRDKRSAEAEAQADAARHREPPAPGADAAPLARAATPPDG